jgi:hypothetical protein
LRIIFVFWRSASPNGSKRAAQGLSRLREKSTSTGSSSNSMEPLDLPPPSAARFAQETSPNQAPTDKRRIMTILHHLFNPPARSRLQKLLNILLILLLHVPSVFRCAAVATKHIDLLLPIVFLVVIEFGIVFYCNSKHVPSRPHQLSGVFVFRHELSKVLSSASMSLPTRSPL